MNRIDQTFARLHEERRAALMPYLPLGYPSLQASRELIRVVSQAGADLIELGVPFSDPLADGPVIQRATQQALKNGMTLAKCLEMAAEARQAGIATPLVLMGYYNPILRFGVEAFVRAVEEAGADGLIVPDLPPEEAAGLDALCRERDIDLVFMAAPTSTEARLRKVGDATRGFLYLVSVVGVTGARDQMDAGLDGFVARVRGVTSKPVCIGFGIANPESAKAVARIADGVIVGSALVTRIGSGADAAAQAAVFVRELRDAVSGARETKRVLG